MFKEWIGFKNGSIKPKSKKIKKRTPKQVLMVSLEVESEDEDENPHGLFSMNSDDIDGKHYKEKDGFVTDLP